MVNLILKRLVGTGYIQIQNLHHRKMRYFLTPQGIAAKSRRAIDYLNRTIRVYETYRQGIARILDEQISKGNMKFVVYGEGDIIDLVKLVLSQYKDAVSYRFCAISASVDHQPDETVLICSLADNEPLHGISILEGILSNCENERI